VTPFIAQLRIYPFKSLDGAGVDEATLVDRGALRFDRAFALADATGALVTAKHEPRVHELRVGYDADVTRATFVSPRLAAPVAFAFDEDPAPLSAWFAQHFDQDIALQRDSLGGFPDDTRAPGPTVISTATLTEVASWFPGLTADDVRRRLRANIEVDGVPAFWEDGLYAKEGDAVAFRAGGVVLEGTNPCARCIVPSRDALTGAVLPGFAKVVSERRKATLPPWAERSRFDHFYRLAVNTQAAPGQSGSAIRVGDTIERLAPAATSSTV
jgi:uncharacterized protein YcbX